MNPDIGIIEAMIIEGGYPQLSGEELKQIIAGKTILGDYAYSFKFVAFINRNGTMEGKNNVGSHHFGEWSINKKTKTFSVLWDSGWDNTTTRAYLVDGKIKFFDSDTGQWRTTFTEISDDCQHPLRAPV
ncbi:MAG: hypothetical protein GY742_15775 [Hyphomicrobiales bacterium]|nr:hypothetical protein [Hyphomicrobiales bacterium]